MHWPDALRGSVFSRYPLDGSTTFRIGGPAEWVLKPNSPEQVAAALETARGEGLPVRCVGLGSNLLVSDEGVGGLVMLMRGLSRLEFEGRRVVAGAGVTNAVILGAIRGKGLGGLECLVGYPGTLGGAVRMNAGGAPGYIAERVSWVRGIDGDGRIVTRDAAQCGFRYRGSGLGDLVVTEVGLELPVADPEEFAVRCRDIHDRKRLAQPLESRSAGC
ncbi:MAG: FAD-binding protein, partial [Planctomycetota bacterium]